jgi:hypothetical protein
VTRPPVTRGERVARLALAGLLAATTWFVVGDLSSDVDDQLDYLVKPGDAWSPAIAVIGVACLAALVGPGRGAWRRWSLATLVRVALLALLVGGGSGLAGRVLTAGVVGANIGGAFAAVVWLVLVPLATWALLVGDDHRRSRVERAA